MVSPEPDFVTFSIMANPPIEKRFENQEKTQRLICYIKLQI